MRESSKDAVEHSTGLALEAVASLIPGIGGVLSIAVGEAVRRAEDTRNARIIEELRAEVQRVLESGRVPDLEAAVTSDEFLAAAHRVVRDMQETSKQEKRRRLAKALGRSLEPRWVRNVEDFAQFVADLDEIAIAVLASAAEKDEQHPWSSVKALTKGATSRLHLRLSSGRAVGALRELESRGLIEWTTDSALADGSVDQAKDGSIEINALDVEQHDYLQATRRGRRFLLFLQDEPGDAPDTEPLSATGDPAPTSV